MTEELQQVYNEATQRPLQVLEIFNEFFGEDRVDMQGLPDISLVPDRFQTSAETFKTFLRGASSNLFILVHFPRVKVTNEYDKYTFVNHLYAKVEIDLDGKLRYKFTLNRAEYTVQHFTNNYMHSHISCIPIHNFEEFQQPCTGTGPINSTMCSLIHEFDEDLWRLFCLELDRYVQVESIAGTPYHRLESLTDKRQNCIEFGNFLHYKEFLSTYELGGYRNNLLTLADIADFTKCVVDSGILKFCYVGGKYKLAMPPAKFYILVSNLFISWYNKRLRDWRSSATFNELVENRILHKCKFINGKLYQINGNSNNLLNYELYAGKKICTFKGRDVVITFSDRRATIDEDDNQIVILSNNIVDYILTKILNTINFRYGNSTKDPNEKRVIFL